MIRLEGQFNRLIKFLNIKKENIIPLVISVMIVTLGLQSYLVGALGFVTVILFVFSIIIIASVAGYAVMKSLFKVAAEFSLLILLAQSFCSLPIYSPESKEALTQLLFIGFLYTTYCFSYCLYGILKEHFKPLAKEKWSGYKIFTIIIYVIYAGAFIRDIYLVANPIVSSLCVYK